ncbi:MAG: LuxR family transcriptional regulator [Novosphingobium sp.]|nr:LuxR family transcriptional regulator [Novosphingobium sp.]
MDRNEPLILIDSDTRRRAAITHALSGSGKHVEPFEDIGEMESRWPRSGVILAFDDGTLIDKLMQHMTMSGAWLPVIGFSEDPEPHRIVEAVLAGAIEYIGWPFEGEVLATALRKARERAESLGNSRLRESMARSRIEKLTRREREVLEGVASGLSNRMIGDKLAISPRTVEIHRANMLNKMGANHTSEAIRIAIEAALVN